MTTRALGSMVDCSSLIEALCARSGEPAAHPGYTYLLDGETEEAGAPAPTRSRRANR